jgi:hypothetical protein
MAGVEGVRESLETSLHTKVRESTGSKSHQPSENLNTTGLYRICSERRVQSGGKRVYMWL